ncbi:MAG: hypothetical protein KAS71_06765, partial [Bacteroidales bacterium]|nr:hypothetical protein [Bacteroidales bacterium]
MKVQINNWLIFVSLFVMFNTQAQDSGLNIGDMVKPFSAKSDNGEIWESSNVIGKKNLVVYFY